MQEERERQRKEAEEAEAAEAAEAERKRRALEEEEEGERRQHEMAAAAAHTVSVTSPTDEGLCAVALYDYQAAADDEISFDPNELITNIEMVSFKIKTVILLICVSRLSKLGAFTCGKWKVCAFVFVSFLLMYVSTELPG